MAVGQQLADAGAAFADALQDAGQTLDQSATEATQAAQQAADDAAQTAADLAEAAKAAAEAAAKAASDAAAAAANAVEDAVDDVADALSGAFQAAMGFLVERSPLRSSPGVDRASEACGFKSIGELRVLASASVRGRVSRPPCAGWGSSSPPRVANEVAKLEKRIADRLAQLGAQVH